MIEDLNILPLVIDILKIAVLGFMIYFVLSVTGRIVRYFFDRNNDKRLLNTMLIVIKTFVWIIFVIWSITVLVSSPILKNPIIIFIFGILFILIVWLFGRDAVSGLILRFENSLNTGRHINSTPGSGKIVKMGFRTLKLETDEGLMLQIPYSKLITEKIISPERIDKVKSFETELELDGSINPEEIKDLIADTIIYSPYSSLIRKPVITFTDTPGNKSRVKIVIFTLNKDYFNKLIFLIKEKLVGANGRGENK